jgi:hypothetical protein
MDCHVCHTQVSKYRCPGCDARTCSVECVVTHKSSSGCSGARDKTAFVPLSAFDELKLLEDYAFLVETEQDLKRQKRTIETAVPSASATKLPSHLSKLVRMAKKSNNVTLLIMPDPFTRRKQNKTVCNREAMMWTVEVLHEGNRTLLHKISDTMLVKTILERAVVANGDSWYGD